MDWGRPPLTPMNTCTRNWNPVYFALGLTQTLSRVLPQLHVGVILTMRGSVSKEGAMTMGVGTKRGRNSMYNM